MEIRTLEKVKTKELETFLVFNNGEDNRNLARKYIKCAFSNDFRKPTFIVATIDDKIIGAAAYSEELFTVDTWGISWVSVHKDFRNQGIAQKIIETCFDEIMKKAKQTITIILGTYPNKTGLYERTGFKTAGYDHSGGSYMLKILECKE